MLLAPRGSELRSHGSEISGFHNCGEGEIDPNLTYDHRIPGCRWWGSECLLDWFQARHWPTIAYSCINYSNSAGRLVKSLPHEAVSQHRINFVKIVLCVLYGLFEIYSVVGFILFLHFFFFFQHWNRSFLNVPPHEHSCTCARSCKHPFVSAKHFPCSNKIGQFSQWVTRKWVDQGQDLGKSFNRGVKWHLYSGPCCTRTHLDVLIGWTRILRSSGRSDWLSGETAVVLQSGEEIRCLYHST